MFARDANVSRHDDATVARRARAGAPDARARAHRAGLDRHGEEATAPGRRRPRRESWNRARRNAANELRLCEPPALLERVGIDEPRVVVRDCGEERLVDRLEP